MQDTPISNPTNELAIRYVDLLARSEGQKVHRLSYDASYPYYPANVTIDGQGARVSGRRVRPDVQRTYVFDDIKFFRDVEWLVLVCLPEDHGDEPIIFKIPKAEWQSRSSITICLGDTPMTWYSPYRWSPQSTQERRWDEELTHDIWAAYDDL
ncbi:hypothetical protein [Deinococcus soli (ex Cha et al. 2016)]|uniref:Uncharacterized protein n=2 Tax=Deinococcus soli (ex Cha et al. 2016) TaxID=1309411 RepID=A0ACC6KJG7_9DEIO|nr:hypothetical protein [Deinococcus soli (ex Cha et al. 2016)]MDR6219845.1 hypothetical protein [Deinococcus soli (ex Cha et al. 2016)]MDR6329897.1 hypothetical protein [Deinococcus soli (ex Cha et al. 2016)]MDR6752752.1 hypothetical protein [Deinococcus soli (ex Cha et al. 2016)]